MASKTIFQTPPINLDELVEKARQRKILATGNKTCTRCSQGTLVYKNVEQWRHSKVSGNLLCKKCYDSEYRDVQRTIDLTKLRKKRGELTFEEKQPIQVQQTKKKLDKYQRYGMKWFKSIPIVSNITTMGGGDQFRCCNICLAKNILIEFQVAVRSMKKRITVHICHRCFKNMYQMLSSQKGHAFSSENILAAKMSRGEWEVRNLQMYGVNPYEIEDKMR